MVATDVLASLEGVRRAGDGWTARCPAHEDRRASLSVGTGSDGRVLVCCHAGCTPEAVAHALGMELRDLFADLTPPKNGLRTPRIVVTYPYVDRNSELLFQVVRMEPKDFRVRRPDGRGGWIWNLDGVRRVPYRLPAVIRAIHAGRVVFLTEGEKDADRLSGLGLVATCNPGGAGKWTAALSEHFRGARVVILPDHDVPGRRHAQDVAGMLHGLAIDVRIVELPDLPPKGDVSDYLDNHALDELKALVRAAPRWETPAAEAETPRDGLLLVKASSLKMKPTEFFWRPRVVLGGSNLLVGEQGLGKSLLTVWLTAQATCGTLQGDLFAAPCDVLIATAEDDLEHTLIARLTAAGADLDRVHFITLRRKGVDVGLTLPDDVGELTVAVEKTSARLVVIDPIMAHLSGKIDSHKDQSLRLAVAPLSKMAERTRCAVLAIGHLNKGESVNFFKRVSGSMGLSAAVRSAVLMAADPEAKEDAEARVLVHGKANLSRKAPALRMRVREVKLHADGESIDTAVIAMGDEAPDVNIEDALTQARPTSKGSKREEAAGWLKANLSDGPRLQEDLFRQAKLDGITDATLRRAKKQLGVLATRVGFGADGRSWWLLPIHAQLDLSKYAEGFVSKDGESKAPQENSGTTDNIGAQQPDLSKYGPVGDVLGDDLTSTPTTGDPEDAE